MSKYIILADGSTIEALTVSFEPTISVRATKEQFLDIWDRLNEDNLKTFQINNNGVVVSKYSDGRLTATQTTGHTSEYLTGTFYLTATPTPTIDEEVKDALEYILGEPV